jgi:hypothetical protein
MQTDVFTQEPVMVGGFAVGETDPDRLLGKYDSYVKVSTCPLPSLFRCASLPLNPLVAWSGAGVPASLKAEAASVLQLESCRHMA